MLQVENIHIQYGDIPVIRGVSLELEAGELVALVGSNNAGKSTTLKAIAGLKDISQGKIIFEGREIQNLPAHKRAELGITLVPEAWQLFAEMTVEENILMGSYIHRHETQKNAARFADLLDMFPALKDKLKRRSSNLSGGERQMVSMCRALMSAPKLLLIDEPSMGLAPIVVDQIFEIINQLSRDQFSILLVEQNLQLALSSAKRGYVLEHGTIVMSDSGATLLADDKVRARYLGL